MQLTLAFLEPVPADRQSPRRELRDTAARAEALDLLARIIAQACETTHTRRRAND